MAIGTKEKQMSRRIFAIILSAGLLAPAAGALAQEHRMESDMHSRMHGTMGRDHMTSRFSADDREAFVDARIAALRAGLRLSGDQEKLWPALEEAIRGFVSQRRADRARGFDRSEDLPAMIRGLAERQAARADSLRKLADAAAPLYATLDDGQKRRLAVLTRGLRPTGAMNEHHGRRERGWRERDGRGERERL
jgi:zinc resistance-associated protein